MSTARYRRNRIIVETAAELLAARQALVRDALAVFGEPAARRMAKSLRVDFETCRALAPPGGSA